MARRRYVWLALGVALLLLAATAAIWQYARSMREVHERLPFNQELLCAALAYHRFAEVHGKSPGGLADIETDRESFPQVCEMIRDGTFVIRWNANLTRDGVENDKYILGHAADVPDHGGWVLMGGGGRRQITATEFHALPFVPVK